MSKIPYWNAAHGEDNDRWEHEEESDLAVEVRKMDDRTHRIVIIEGDDELVLSYGSDTDGAKARSNAVRLLRFHRTLGTDINEKELEEMFSSPVDD